MCIELWPGNHFKDDIDKLRTHPLHGKSVALLRAFIEELKADQSALALLNHANDSCYKPLFNIKLIGCFQKKGYNIYRVRPLDGLGHFRIIIAYDVEYDDFYMLALVLKKPENKDQIIKSFEDYYYDYELNHPITTRIYNEYDDALGLRKIS